MNYDKSDFYTFKMTPGFDGKSMRAQNYSSNNTLITVKIASTDTRALNFFANGPAQLHPNSPGIIFIDTKNVINGLKEWPKLIRKEFDEVPDINKIISAFVIHNQSTIILPDDPTPIIQTATVLNKNANYTVPEWIVQKLKSTEVKK
jgi:hypothetical protein